MTSGPRDLGAGGSLQLDPYDLARFLDAQDRVGSFCSALDEIRSGLKVGHWIWWTFPQLIGLGSSPTSTAYSIKSLDEARSYLCHPILGDRLRGATRAMLAQPTQCAADILGRDDVKFHSSMTLFSRAEPDEALFREALDQFFHGQPDPRTDALLFEQSEKLGR